MTDYTQNEDYSAKDALAANDPEKVILGSDIDSELGELQTSVNSKYDNTDLATQVQAEAGTDNTTLMTPLRVAQYIGSGGFGSGSAGALPDIGALADPGADRIVFWDESDDEVEWLTVGTGLAIAVNTLTTDDANIVHDNLSGFVANEHIDHSGVVLTLEEGLQWSSGGTDLTSSATATLDIDGLTEESTLDTAADWLVFYDNGAGAHRKVQLEDVVGQQLGDGKWYRNAVQSITTTEATVVWNTSEQDNLSKGTFSTSTGVYTVGANATRILISVNARVENIAAGQAIIYKVRRNSTDECQTQVLNSGGSGASAMHANFSVVMSLSATDTVDVRAALSTGSSQNQNAAEDMSNISIVELA